MTHSVLSISTSASTGKGTYQVPCRPRCQQKSTHPIPLHLPATVDGQYRLAAGAVGRLVTTYLTAEEDTVV